MNTDLESTDTLHLDVDVSGFDEMLDEHGELRDHWRYVIGSLRMLGRADLRDRQSEVRRLLRQDGAAHDIGSGGNNRGAWELDPIPILISSDDWANVEAGLVQRAELLDLILADLYGDQKLIQRGTIPVEVVHAHSGFLRPLLGAPSLGEHRLVHYNADLSRGRDGRFQVIADRTRIPTGSGYALENRIVLSRVYPSLFRDAHVHRLAHYFRGVRRGLIALSPAGRDDPRIVILTPGPASAGYFEHSFLAGYLGYPLVEPADLTVRRGRVWLRSLDGLQQIDVIVRGVGDERCDPLELQPGLGAGVPGLVEAARRGHVAIVNPLGAAAVENPALLPFLPAMAEHLLGVPLLLDSIPTWWCGRDADLERVIDELDSMVVVPIDRSDHSAPVIGAELSSEARSACIERLRAQPIRWVGQRLPEGGWVPSLVGDQIISRPSTIRAMLVARDGSYVAMPGGLGWVPAPGDPPSVPMLADGLDSRWTKDVWVLASEPERQGTSLLNEPDTPTTGLTPAVQPTPPTISGSLPSRAAENLYWLGRYSERAEQLIRWARTVLARVSDVDDRGDRPAEWLDDLLAVLSVISGQSGPATSEPDSPSSDIGAAVIAALFPPDGSGLVNTLERMGRSAASVRELLSGDTWQVIAAMELELTELKEHAPTTAAATQQTLTRLLTSLLALVGLAAESTVRDPVWLFLDAGRRLERAQIVVATARVTLVAARDSDSDALVWESFIVANESLITYRRRYRSRLRMAFLLELLLGDRNNPRSLIYQLDRLGEHGASLPTDVAASGGAIVEGQAARAAELLNRADPARLAGHLPGGDRRRLAELLDEVSEILEAMGDAVGRHFLHVEPPRSLDLLEEISR